MMMTHYRQPQRLNESSISLSPTLRENSSTVFADTFSTKVENSYTFIKKMKKLSGEMHKALLLMIGCMN